MIAWVRVQNLSGKTFLDFAVLIAVPSSQPSEAHM